MHFPFSSFSSTGPADENERNDGHFRCHVEEGWGGVGKGAEWSHGSSLRRVTVGGSDTPSKYGNELVFRIRAGSTPIRADVPSLCWRLRGMTRSLFPCCSRADCASGGIRGAWTDARSHSFPISDRDGVSRTRPRLPAHKVIRPPVRVATSATRAPRALTCRGGNGHIGVRGGQVAVSAVAGPCRPTTAPGTPSHAPTRPHRHALRGASRLRTAPHRRYRLFGGSADHPGAGPAPALPGRRHQGRHPAADRRLPDPARVHAPTPGAERTPGRPADARRRGHVRRGAYGAVVAAAHRSRRPRPHRRLSGRGPAAALRRPAPLVPYVDPRQQPRSRGRPHRPHPRRGPRGPPYGTRRMAAATGARPHRSHLSDRQYQPPPPKGNSAQ